MRFRVEDVRCFPTSEISRRASLGLIMFPNDALLQNGLDALEKELHQCPVANE
jgi:hypothetical protein